MNHLNRSRPWHAVPLLIALAFVGEWLSPAWSAETAKADAAKPFWSRDVKLIDGAPPMLTLLGARKDGQFMPYSVILPEKPGPSLSLPLQANLVPKLNFRSFGLDERVRIRREGNALTLRCAAGSKPAGAVLFLAGFHFPRALQGEMTIRGEATASFEVGFAENDRDAREFHPLPQASSRAVQAIIPASAWTKLNSPGELVIACPDGAASLSLAGIEIEPVGRRITRPAGTWIWDVAKWLGRGDQLISELRRFDIGEVFIQVQIAKGGIVERAALVRLITDLAAAGIRVNTVEGDGRMAGPEGRAVAIERARLLAGLKAETGGKVLSFQYDIEPYVLPEFESDPDFWWAGWGTTLSELAAAVNEPVSAVVPFWLMRHEAATEALDRARGSVSRIVVMSYRTTAKEVEEIAEEWLDWGRRTGIPVAFALENGFVPTEYAQHYLRAEQGKLVLEVSGKTGRVELLAERALGTGNRLAYSFKSESKIDSERISFLSDRGKLKKVRTRLQANLPAWDAFDGMLVHEVIPP